MATEVWNDLTLVPGLFLYWICAYIYGNVLLAMLARKQERAADLYSWTLMGRSGPFITAMRKLTELNLFVLTEGPSGGSHIPPHPTALLRLNGLQSTRRDNRST